MPTDYVTDTHGLIWYLEDSPLLGPAARNAFDACDRGDCLIYVPTISLVELLYLQEKKRLSQNLYQKLREALAAGDTGLRLADLTLGVAAAVQHVARTEVPDMPDRIIAATALSLGLPLISRDRKIQLSAVTTLW